ncbi:YdcF family protein [Roseovarius amoyensis]|uniref:YdcF family protein n=1 Tax=Roseovarius amoyensis TaxID=2211448 RepID=UPI000DBE3619|nr:YdcF family protein [Roseovarius amoyensis]
MTGNTVDDTADAALVLGAAAHADGRPSAALRRRALHAAHLYDQGRVRLILASGGPPGASPTEAELIRQLCIKAGVPDSAILVEPCAATTAENIRLSLPILRKHKITRVCLVTDRFHAPRAAMVARAAGLSFTLSCPHADGVGWLKLCRLWLREGVAIVVYRYRIWRGR